MIKEASWLERMPRKKLETSDGFAAGVEHGCGGAVFELVRCKLSRLRNVCKGVGPRVSENILQDPRSHREGATARLTPQNMTRCRPYRYRRLSHAFVKRI